MARSGKVLNGFERVTLALGAREAFFRSLLENPRSIPRIASAFLSERLPVGNVVQGAGSR